MTNTCIPRLRRLSVLSSSLVVALIISACASMDPAKVDVKLPETAPTMKITSYTQALRNLGLMSEIYETGPLKIQSNPIGDNTGTSGATGGEIPRDITEMLKSALNSIGGNVIFIPYDPAFIQNQMVTGYSNFDKKLIPDVVVSGGITEFDRGLETRGTNTDAGAEAQVKGLPSFMTSDKVSLDYGEGTKSGLARITLDFNLLDFKTMAGISRMNTVNTMEVTKALSEKELGINLFGITFGRKGSIKKVQGRHAAVRLLVELSMIQMVGKHLVLPYWRLLGDDALPDEVVMSALKKSYYRMNDPTRIYMAQQWLYLYGYEVAPNGVLDNATLAALKQAKPAFTPQGNSIDVDTFVELYVNLPIDEKTLGRRNVLTAYLQQQPAAQTAQAQPAQAQPAQTQASQPQQTAAPQQEAAPRKAAASRKSGASQKTAASQPARQVESGQRSSIGRILSDSEW